MAENRRASFSQIYKGNNCFLINLVCPDNSSISTSHSVRNTVNNVLQDACRKLSITRVDIFGLAVHECNEYKFLSPKKNLYKFLPSETIVCGEQGLKKREGQKDFLNNNIKTCRLYLRIKIFIVNVDTLNGRNLYYYYEQARLDSLRYQNWLQTEGFTELFYDVAAKAILLKYGESWIEVFNNKSLQLHYYLPMCEQKEKTWETLEEKLCLLDTTKDCQDVNLADKLPLRKSDSTNSRTSRKNTITEEDVIFVDNKEEELMLDAIKEISELPFYGVHYYHVSMKIKDGDSLTNCKLGIGPVGITVVVSPYYTIWKESLNVSWSIVVKMSYEKNVLEVFCKSNTESQQFVCLNEIEAKYLYKQLRENHWYYLVNTSEKKWEKSKRNSIGVLMNKRVERGDENKFPVTPMTRRSSFTTFFFPRKFSK